MTGSYKVVRRFTIAGGLAATAVLIDGLVLLFTNGLSSDATPVFPVLGGVFSRTRSSGASLVILAAIMIALTLVGRWTLGRRLRAEEQRPAASSDVQGDASRRSMSGPTAVAQHDS